MRVGVKVATLFTAPPSRCYPFLTPCGLQVRLGVVEGKRVPGKVQLPEAPEQNEGEHVRETTGHPGLRPHSRVFVL